MKTIRLSEENADFFDRVYEVVKLVPEGRVTSYGAIANYLGAKRSSRMVGWAMNGCANRNDVPAHRVVNRNGVLTGKAHFGGNRMEEALQKEGVEIEEDTVKNFKSLFWDPAVELM